MSDCRYSDCDAELSSKSGRSIHEKSVHGSVWKGKWDNEEYLRKKYIKDGLGMKEIADRHNTNYNQVRASIKEYGIKTRHANETRYHNKKQRLEEHKDEIKERYIESEEPLYILAEKWDVDDATLKRYLQEWGVNTRDISEQHLTETDEKLNDKEWLKTQYREQERYTPELAKELDVGPGTVYNALKRHGIEIWDHAETIRKEGRRGSYGPNWRQRRKERLDKDGWECVVCNVDNHQHKDMYNKSLHVHHIQPLRSFVENGRVNYEAANRITNLITLCAKCHRKWEGVPLRPQ